MYAILADIHSNLESLVAVLEDIKHNWEVEEFWCLGDIVGYGPDPQPCLKLISQRKHVCIAGNHDWAAIGKINVSYFNQDAANACLWTSRQLSADSIRYLANLPLTLEKGDFTMAHGSPREPVWEYLLSIESASDSFALFKTQFCLVGHSHIPLIFKEEDGSYSSRRFSTDSPLTAGSYRFIINPGGVGQPRDGDPRASYALYDSETRIFTLHRVPYDIAATQSKMRRAGLPRRLIERLDYGI